MHFSKKKFDQDGYCVFDLNKNFFLKTKKKILNLISSVISEKYNIKKSTEKKIINLFNSK